MSREYINNLAFYTAKWFLIYSVKIFVIGFVFVLSVTTAAAAMGGGSKKSSN